MPVVFNATAGSAIYGGSAVAVNGNRGASTIVTHSLTDDEGKSDPGEHVITVGLKIKQEVSAEFQVSLRRKLYVIPFGDKPSELQLAFTVFTLDCEGRATEGIRDMLDYYDDVKLKPDDSDPLSIIIGGDTMQVFCVALSMDISQIEAQLVATANATFIGWRS